jgi:hypothetical protein
MPMKSRVLGVVNSRRQFDPQGKLIEDAPGGGPPERVGLEEEPMRPTRASRKQQQRELMVKATRLLRAAARREHGVPPPLERCRRRGRTIFGSKIWAGSWRRGAAAFGEGDLTQSNAALGRDLPGQQGRRTET